MTSCDSITKLVLILTVFEKAKYKIIRYKHKQWIDSNLRFGMTQQNHLIGKIYKICTNAYHIQLKIVQQESTNTY